MKNLNRFAYFTCGVTFSVSGDGIIKPILALQGAEAW